MYFIAKDDGNNSAGVSWIFVGDNLKWYSEATTKNTLGSAGKYDDKTQFGVCAEGQTWVNGTLLSRLDDSLAGKSFDPQSLEAKHIDPTNPKMPLASYRWVFDPADARALP